MNINSAKKILRKEMKNLLQSIDSTERQRQSLIVFEKLISLRQYQESKRISIFLSMQNEINTEKILKHLFDNRKEVFVPRYEGPKMEMVKLFSMKDYETLPLTIWKIKQPRVDERREDALKTGGLDLIIVPGVAFTSDGKRLGHGAGYYDRYFKDCEEKQMNIPYKIALAFKEQIRAEIPTTEFDYKIDLVLTEDTSKEELEPLQVMNS